MAAIGKGQSALSPGPTVGRWFVISGRASLSRCDHGGGRSSLRSWRWPRSSRTAVSGHERTL